MKFLTKAEKWIFYLFVFFIFLQARFVWHIFGGEFNEWTSLYIYATDILAGTVLALWGGRILKGDSKIKIGREGGALAVFLFFAGVSILGAGNKWLGLYNTIKLFEFSLLFLYLKNNFSRVFNIETFWKIFVASAAFQSVFAVWQFFRQSSLGLNFFNESPTNPQISGVAKIVVNGVKIVRAYGLVPHPNILAAMLVVAIFGLVFLFLKNYGKLNAAKRIIFAGVFCLLSLALFLTFSRAVTLIGLLLLFGGLSFLLWRYPQYKKSVIISLAALFVVGCLLLVVFWPYVSARYEASELIGGQALDLRIFYNKIAVDLIEGNPIFGIGTGNFVSTVCSYSFMKSWMCQPVHNIYLLIAAETGILGLFFFLFFLFFIVFGTYRSSLDKLSIYVLLLTVFCFLLTGLLDHFLFTLQQGQLMLWITLGILASFSIGQTKEKSL